MLDYSFFYDLSKYLNDTWKGSFTEKEIAENAYDYKISYDFSKDTNKPDATIQTLIDGLKEDCKNNPDSESSDYLTMLESEF